MDHAIENRHRLIASVSVPAPSADDQIKAMQERNNAKRIAAINAMGAKLLNHPAYSYEANPHHSPYVHESAVLALIRQKARNEGRL